MSSFRFDATVLEPESLTPEVGDKFESAMHAHGATDRRVQDDRSGPPLSSYSRRVPHGDGIEPPSFSCPNML